MTIKVLERNGGDSLNPGISQCHINVKKNKEISVNCIVMNDREDDCGGVKVYAQHNFIWKGF